MKSVLNRTKHEEFVRVWKTCSTCHS